MIKFVQMQGPGVFFFRKYRKYIEEILKSSSQTWHTTYLSEGHSSIYEKNDHSILKNLIMFCFFKSI